MLLITGAHGMGGSLLNGRAAAHFAGSRDCFASTPGPHGPGFMLPPAAAGSRASYRLNLSLVPPFTSFYSAGSELSRPRAVSIRAAPTATRGLSSLRG